MGNPCRYFFENKFTVSRPQIDEDKKELKILVFDGNEKNFVEYYENVNIDFYSAPDVILNYRNGNCTRGEWMRYVLYEFKGLNLIKKEIVEDMIEVIFNFEKYIYICGPNDFNDKFYYEDIPLGVFFGMTIEEIKDYKKRNILEIKDFKDVY